MDQKKIGKYIAVKRKALGMTQVALAEKLNVSDKSVSKWERGICLPDASKYKELCDTLGVTLNELFAGEDLATEAVAAQSEHNIIDITNDYDKQIKRRNRLISSLVAVILVMIVITCVNIKTYHSLLVRDYDITSGAFYVAVNDIDAGELSNREVLIKLGDKAFNAIWQTRNMETSIFISSKWYSDNLYNFLFECTAANDLSVQEMNKLIEQISGISAELEKIDWEKLRDDGTALWHLNEIFTVIENVDDIAELL